MTRLGLALGLALLAGTGSAHGQSCPTDGCPPTSPLPGVKLFRITQQQPDQGTPGTIPGPILYRQEVEPPIWAPSRPAPPVLLFRVPPPAVAVYTPNPHRVDLHRLQPPAAKPPQECHPMPGVTLFHLHPEKTREVPPVHLPPVTIFRQEAPPHPVSCPDSR